jgi:hypothetical protein
MGFWNFAGKIGTILLAALILFPSTGIHDWHSHISLSRSQQAPEQERFSTNSELDNPGSDHCNACYFNQLLRHCMFPVSPRPALTESFRPRPRLHRELIAFLNPTPEFNRGPPATAAFA